MNNNDVEVHVRYKHTGGRDGMLGGTNIVILAAGVNCKIKLSILKSQE